MSKVSGLHHITAIAGPAQENLDFYAGVLGLRLVKKSVNQDDPGTYHLFYADAEGHPGTDITFFPWAELAPRRDGYGLSTEVSLAVGPGSLPFWQERLTTRNVEVLAAETRFGEKVLPLVDPHGLRLALVESESSLGRPFAAWERSPIPREYQIRGLEGARMLERDLGEPGSFLREILGFREISEENGWRRFGVAEATSGQYVDLQAAPNERRGAWGRGSVHHLAWRVADEADQLAVRAQVALRGAQPTPVIDRFWFKSVYFREPGGVLFELATDGPGFAVDEAVESLGEALVLPPWLEPDRPTIEANLPPLTLPRA